MAITINGDQNPSNLNDRLTGSELNGGVINGLLGNDTIIAYASTNEDVGYQKFANTLNGGDGDDLIEIRFVFSFNSEDQVSGGSGNDTLAVAPIDPSYQFDRLILDENASIEVLDVRQLRGNVVDLTGVVSVPTDFSVVLGYDSGSFIGSENGEVVDGGDSPRGDGNYGIDGDDTIDGRGGADSLYGNLGHDVIHGGTGDDLLVGGRSRASFDQHLYYPGDDYLDGGDGDDTLEGGEDADTILGGAGNDEIRITGLDLSDSISGGEGDDTLRLTGAVNLLNANSFASIEHFFVGPLSGTAAADSIDLSGFAVVSMDDEGVLLGGGADRFLGFAGGDLAVGGRGADRLDGAGGGDTLVGGGGDTLIGGRGADLLIVDGEYIGSLEFAGGAGQDALSIRGGVTAKGLALGAAASVETLDLEGRVLNGTKGGDVFDLGGVDFYLAHGAFATGGGADRFVGGSAAESVDGGGGADTLDGGGGADTLTGGAGGDVFVFSTRLAMSNADEIADFETGRDRIWLDHDVFAALPQGRLAANAFVIGSRALDREDRIVYDAETGLLFYDQDGSRAGAATLIAKLQSDLALTRADFAVV